MNGVAIFTGYELKPGEVRTCTVSVANAGTSPAEFRLLEAEAANGFGDHDLKLSINEVGSRGSVMVYRGEIGGVPDAGIGLGLFAAGEERAYFFTTGLSIDSSDPGLGRAAGAVYRWKATPASRRPGP